MKKSAVNGVLLSQDSSVHSDDIDCDEPDEVCGTEGNVLSAIAVFSASIVLDALIALPTTLAVDVATSLRTTALVLVALVASPPVDANLIFEQRGLACALLVTTAFVGLHSGGVNGRIADSLYSLTCGWSILLIFSVSPPKPKERGHDPKGKRENITALAAAFLGYSGARILRAGLYHSGEVSRFSSSHEDIESQGYAIADDLVSSTLAFGGTLCMCAAAIILANHDSIYDEGCKPVTSVVAHISILIFISAFIVQIACFARLDEMEVLFGESACVGEVDVCYNAFRARRLYTANSSPAPLWACAVGLTIFSFPHDNRCRTRREYFSYAIETGDRNCAIGSGHLSLFASFVAVLVVYVYSDSVWRATELVLLFFSIPAAWYSSTWISCALHATGMLMYTVGRLGSPLGFDLSFLTHWFVMATIVITVCLALTTLVSWLLYSSCVSTGRYIAWIENSTAILVVALVSIQLFLTISSLAILGGYDGSMMESKSWRSASLQWATQHSLGFFFSAALVGGRFECHSGRVDKYWMQATWFSLPAILTVLWLINVYSTSAFIPYGTTGDVSSIIIATLAALLPWVLSGLAL
tara:strand:- start:4072 stop:5826 length:1755 start_codon:yes stop_codon:yes gene_type:complete